MYTYYKLARAAGVAHQPAGGVSTDASVIKQESSLEELLEHRMQHSSGSSEQGSDSLGVSEARNIPSEGIPYTDHATANRVAARAAAPADSTLRFPCLRTVTLDNLSRSDLCQHERFCGDTDLPSDKAARYSTKTEQRLCSEDGSFGHTHPVELHVTNVITRINGEHMEYKTF